MNKFKKGGFKPRSGGFGGRPNFGGAKKFGNKFSGGRDGNDRPERRLEFFPAICSECKKKCEVPFRPTGDKPVYCRDCFGKQRQVPGRNSNGRDNVGGDFRVDARPQREYQPEPLRVQSNGGIDEIKQRLAALESKVNRILELVSQKPESSIPKVEKATKVKAPARKTAKKTKK
ncbi:MAG: CxxC-x17-CxxC domain-containing protein [Patescibacteria group bacterium]